MSTIEHKLRSENILTGEIKPKGITITRSDSATPTITSATVTVYKTIDGSEVTAAADCTVDGADVWAVITAGSTPMAVYLIWAFVDGNYTVKARMDFTIVQG